MGILEKPFLLAQNRGGKKPLDPHTERKGEEVLPKDLGGAGVKRRHS